MQIGKGNEVSARMKGEKGRGLKEGRARIKGKWEQCSEGSAARCRL
jgi:hypothetical protein